MILRKVNAVNPRMHPLQFRLGDLRDWDKRVISTPNNRAVVSSVTGREQQIRAFEGLGYERLNKPPEPHDFAIGTVSNPRPMIHWQWAV
jgi:hypothetical protein